MRIAIVIERYRPWAGGIERSTEQIARRLAARGHAVTLLTNEGPAEPEALPGVRIVVAEGPRPSHAYGLWQFSRWAEQRLDTGDFDVAMSMTLAVAADVLQPRSGTAKYGLARRLACERAWRRPARRLLALLQAKRRALLALEARTLHSDRVRRIVAISDYVAGQLTHGYGVPAAKIERIPNAADVELPDPSTRRRWRQRLRRSLGLAPEDVAFLFVGMDPVRKGLDPLLHALARLREARPEARLIVAGAREPRYLRLARRLRLDPVTRWTGPTRRIDAVYAAADVTVLPTFDDPASKVVIESLRHGVPAISTRYNGASQWIADPVAGAIDTSPFAPPPESSPEGEPADPAGRVIGDPHDTAALADAMAALCDADFRARCAAAAARLDPRLTMDRHVDQLERLLQHLAAGQPAAAPTA